jgi:putative intracellular protease/amidase
VKIVITLFEDLTVLDAIGPYELLQRLPGATVTFAGQRRGEIRDDGKQLGLTADASFDEVDSADVLLVPGGMGTLRLIEDEPFLAWVRRIHATTQWTTSVCSGSLVLGAAGLLDGLDATSHWGVVELLESFGARYTGERVVRQGKIITAAGVSSGIDMALTLAGLIAGDDVAKAIQLMMEYDPQPPYDAGSVAKAGPDVMQLIRDGLVTATPVGAAS